MSLLALAVSGRGIVPPGEPALLADDEGFTRGRAAFESLRVYDGRPFRLEEHLDRLEASALRLALAPPPRAELRELAALALAEAGEAEVVLRFYWTPSDQALVLVGELPPGLDEIRRSGLRLASLEIGPPWLLGGVKSTSYALNLAAQAEARRRGADDALFTADGVALECPTANVVWRRGSELFTPALELGVLAGVTRAVVLDGLAVSEGAYRLDDLPDELAVCSSIREVVAVVALDGRSISRGTLADELQAALRAATRS